MATRVEFCGNVEDDLAGNELVGLKISCDAFELNVHIPVADLDRLDKVASASWDAGSIEIGHSANAPAWWSSDDGEVRILVGRDNQTWDFGISFPLEQLADLRKAIAERYH